MQAKLPDINAALVRYRSVAIEAFQTNDDESARMALSNMVALLPEEFKVVVNTDEYNEKIKEKIFMPCSKCKKEIPDDKIKRERKRLSSEEQYLKTFSKNPPITQEDKEYDWIWKCPKCSNENLLSETELVHDKPSLPYYLGVIPEAPQRNFRNPLMDRMYFIQRFREWFKIAFAEIESKVGIYRAEYNAQNQDHADTFGDKD